MENKKLISLVLCMSYDDPKEKCIMSAGVYSDLEDANEEIKRTLKEEVTFNKAAKNNNCFEYEYDSDGDLYHFKEFNSMSELIFECKRMLLYVN